jgi:undecaprenyl phosphate-alpha-L-ara4N flippase subunit ArnE
MSFAQLLWGIACVFGISGGQIFFKLAAATSAPIKNFNSIWNLFINTNLIIALSIYMITAILWVWLLRVVPLKQVYPLVALAFIIVPILARLFLNEKLELKTIIGGITILIGVYISVR